MKKTFQDLREWIGFNTPEVAPIATPQAVDDVDSAAFHVDKDDILDKLNAYCHDICNRPYMNPYYPLNTLWKKLSMVGINFNLKSVMLVGDQGTVTVPITRFGGRYGYLPHQQKDQTTQNLIRTDDGTDVPGGLSLVVKWAKGGGSYNLDVQITHTASHVSFGEEVVHESTTPKTDHVAKYKITTKGVGNGPHADIIGKHPDGHSFNVKPSFSGKDLASWTHTSKNGKETSGSGAKSFNDHINAFHSSVQESKSDSKPKSVGKMKVTHVPTKKSVTRDITDDNLASIRHQDRFYDEKSKTRRYPKPKDYVDHLNRLAAAQKGNNGHDWHHELSDSDVKKK